MTAHIEGEGHGGCLTIHITGAASAAAAGLGSIANPEGRTLLILRSTIYFVTKSTGGANLSVGVTTAAAAATDIINTLAVGGVTDATVYNGHAMQNTSVTEITTPAIWTSAKYITITGSATTVGLEAYLYLEYIPV
jgi:hypothetical protein